MSLPTYLLRAQALDVAYAHIGWCVAQKMTLEEIFNAVDCDPPKYATIKDAANLYASVWRAMQRDPDMREAA